jgi:anti-repressor protein
MENLQELRTFENSEFGELEVTLIDGKVYFPATKCAKILGYEKPHNAIERHCRGSLKQGVGVQTGTKVDGAPAIQTVQMSFIPEGDLYRLIIRSNLPATERFERWVFDEVLPSIRKHGAYATPEAAERMLNDPDVMIKVLEALKDERAARDRLEAQVKMDAPKVQFADAVADSETTILVRELAKLLKGNGVDIGQNRLFARLREDGYLIKKNGADYNSPTQYAMDRDLFRVEESVVKDSNCHGLVSRTTKVTGKGQRYFVRYFLSEECEST